MAVSTTAWSREADRCEHENELRSLFQTATSPSPALACLSVRSAFDLFLRVADFPTGSELILTAINIPSMAEIVRAHGLVPVSLDLEPESLTASTAQLQKLFSPRTVLVLVAHIFGRQLNVEPLLEASRAAGLLFVEDCAECFQGLDYLGHPNSDLVLFSFGIIKCQTCFGGGIVKIRDVEMYSKMQAKQAQYLSQTNGQYLAKLLKFFLLYPALNSTWFMQPAMTLTRAVAFDHKRAVVRLLRTFPRDLLFQIRRRPSVALLAFMCLRLRPLKAALGPVNLVTKEKGDFASKLLSSHAHIPGSNVKVRNYWLFPIVVVSF